MSTDPSIDKLQLLHLVQQLPEADRYRLINEIGTTAVPVKRCSILALRGLGKEIWKDIDAQDYINKERDSWTG